jgi:hypothetical protein
MLAPSGQPFSYFISNYDTSADTRDVASAAPPSPSAMAAAAETLASDLEPIRNALAALSSRAFRLILSHTLSSLEIRHSALLSERFLPSHTHGTRHLFIHMATWHFIALHPPLLSTLWDTSHPRLHTLLTSVAGRIGTLAPRATHTTTTQPHPPPATPPVRLRLNVFLRRVQLTAPSSVHLAHFLHTTAPARLTEDETTAIFQTPTPPHAVAWSIPTLAPDEPSLVLVIADDAIVSLQCGHSLAQLTLPTTTASRFLPPQFHWRTPAPSPPWWRQREGSPPPWFRAKLRAREGSPISFGDRTTVRPLPLFHAGRVIQRASRWKKRLGRYLGQAATVILDGKLCLPLDRADLQPMSRPNLKSCFESPAATAFVDQIVSEYLVTNVVSWYPPDRPPLCICPIGTVPKKTHPFFRLVIDARGPNAFTSRWGTNMRSLASAAHIFQPGSVCFTLDLGKAYICSPYQGCAPGLQRRIRADGTPYLHVGCTPETCRLACSKVLLGFRWRQQLLAFNAPMFGGKVSGNILDTLVEPIDRWTRAQAIPSLRWVDDSIFAIPPRPEYRHDTSHCGGIGSCWLCDDTLSRALKAQHDVFTLLEELGFTFNEKRTPPSQRGEFIGMGWDTLRCTYRIVAGKAIKMADSALDMSASCATSRRLLAQLRGKLVWFSPCLYSVRLLTRAINKMVGSPASDTEWDAHVPLPPEVVRELSHWDRTLRAQTDHERPMWRPRPEQLISSYLDGNTDVGAYLEIDASHLGWGCLLRIRTDAGWTEQRTSVAWGPDDPVIQVQCEAQALASALHLFLGTLRGRIILHATDCAPTVDLPARGSASSQRLQAIALDIWFLCSRHGIHLVSAWLPGEHMLRSGTDALSRAGLDDPHSARLTPAGWDRVTTLASSHGLALTVDWFADHLNRQLPSFWSRTATPGASGTDAFTAPSWHHKTCPSCKSRNAIGSFLFPPVPLLDKVIHRAQHDGACGVIVVPRQVGSVWWPVLLTAALGPPAALSPSFVNSDRNSCSPSYARYPWNIVAFRFGNLPAAQPCPCPPPPAPDDLPSSLLLQHELLLARIAQALVLDHSDPPRSPRQRPADLPDHPLSPPGPPSPSPEPTHATRARAAPSRHTSTPRRTHTAPP